MFDVVILGTPRKPKPPSSLRSKCKVVFPKLYFFCTFLIARERSHSLGKTNSLFKQTEILFFFFYFLFSYEKKKDKYFRSLVFLFYRQKGNYLFGSTNLLFRREKFLLSFFFRQESVYLEPLYFYGKGVIFLRGGMLSLTSECLCYLASKIAVF